MVKYMLLHIDDKGGLVVAESSFFEAVYGVVAKIPPGKVATYGQIALIIGRPRGGRVVGYAMAGVAANRDLPCHRVVNRLGELSPEHVFGSREYQRMLLETEGITFLEDGRIDLVRHLWQP